eukprot:CAMPEP_0175587014 /NCGR_PEP_ID=MMETSP0096-20121207/50535_1 /TAXON_ID=311494 /ORGANISM="Alexandrium monilatum, Strain CCMP3105" /LENGTH=116 /DNA_ID=CAMNT_0016890907 /DNA_START=34 /DNA_END=379 /DNA_ORIENTATION=-
MPSSASAVTGSHGHVLLASGSAGAYGCMSSSLHFGAISPFRNGDSVGVESLTVVDFTSSIAAPWLSASPTELKVPGTKTDASALSVIATSPPSSGSRTFGVAAWALKEEEEAHEPA